MNQSQYLNDPMYSSSGLVSVLSKHRSLGFLIVAVFYVATLLLLPLRFIDDAYISFRYAENFRLHHQLVFNLGERVEGITNLLWTLLLSSVTSIGHGDIVTWALALSIAANLWTLYRVWQLGEGLLRIPIGAIVAAVLLATNTQFVLATTNGLEAGLYAALLCEICFQLRMNRRYKAALFVSLLFMTRPDGITAVPGFVFACYLLDRRWRSVIGPLGVFCAVLLCVTVFRRVYYQDWLPNSVIAKSYPLLKSMPLIRFGCLYIIGFLASSGYWLIIPILSIIQRITIWKQISPKNQACLAFCVLTLAASWIVVIRNGGDWMPSHRLLSQYSPLYAIITLLLVHQHKDKLRLAALLLLWPLTVMAYQLMESGVQVGRFSRSGPASDFWNVSASRLGPLVASHDVVSAEALGFLSFQLLSTRMHDPVGLTDRYIARRGRPVMLYGKEDTTYTLGTVAPTIALWHYTGHLSGVSYDILSNYRTWRYGPDAGKMSTIIMIRKDQVSRLYPAVADWTEIPTHFIPR